MTKQMEFFEWARTVKTWEGFKWPMWVPEHVRSEIERFYDREGPAGWIQRSEDPYNNLPVFGEEVCMKDSEDGPLIEGRWVTAWGNMGRIVKEDGSHVVSSTCWYKPEFWASEDPDEGYSVGPFRTREEAVAQAPHRAHGDFERESRFWVGRAKPVQIRYAVDAADVIERLQEEAGEAVGEGAEGWLDNVTRAQEAELEASMANAVRLWLKRNKLENKFFHIVDITEHRHDCETRKDCEAIASTKVGA